MAEPRTRSFIVRALPTDYALLESLSKQLDTAGQSAQVEFRLVLLTNAPPDKVLPLVQQRVTQLNLVRPGEPLTVTVDQRTRGLLVAARDTLLVQVEKMIRQLVTPSAYIEAEVLVVPLKMTISTTKSAISSSSVEINKSATVRIINQRHADTTVSVQSGCASSPERTVSPPSGSKDGIVGLHLFSMPVAANLDSSPGPDGFVVRVYATSRNSAKGVPLTSGQLDILMFDGALKENDPKSTEPLRTWSRPASELRQFSLQTSLGIGYRFVPRWGDAKPRHRIITVVVRYTPAHGRSVYSAPNTIAMTPR